MAYVEFHARSAFSFLRSASLPEQLAAEGARLGLTAMALCDRDGVYGIPRFHTAAQEQGLRAMVGCELTMEDETVLPVVVLTRRGYQNLCRLLTTTKLRAEKGEGRTGWKELATQNEGLVALSGDEEGPVLQAWRQGGRNAVADSVGRLREIFGEGRLWVELQRHRVRGEERSLEMLRDMAAAESLPLLATGGIVHATAGTRDVLDVMTCIRNHTTLDAAGVRLTVNAERHLRSAKAMEGRFADLPEAMANTERLAEQVEFGLENLGYEFPTYPVPAGETMGSFLRKMVWYGAQQRYGGISPAVRTQLERELALIAQLGFCGYFLVVWDLCLFCREQNILVQGRGSAANSAVCYSLGITNVDPVGGRLLFERFLSEGRKSWPDIDLDLPSGDRRERAIQEVYRRYGPRGAGMVANVITYRGRSTMRELGKVMGIPEDLIDRFSKLYGGGDFQHTIDLQTQLRMAGMAETHPRLPSLLAVYEKMYGLPRHLGQHSGGMVICQNSLDTVVPLENASMPGRVVLQWDKDDCEDLGLVKVDLLGLGMMAALQDSLEMCQQRGHPVDLGRMPKDDAATFELLQKADTIGVFQVESRAQMATLPRMKPKTFYDVAIEVAIIRPGPIHGEAVNPYLERRAGRQDVTYMDDRLKPILERTLGVVLFQEQILKIAMVMAKFTASEADELRRALGFTRNTERFDRMEGKLRVALQREGAAPTVVEEICRSLASFALYGFPESHAISFALIAYASSYLKAHYAPEFYAGLLNNQPLGFYSPSTLIQDARRHGVRVKPVCVHRSDWPSVVEPDDALRLGFDRVKGLNEKSARAMIEARKERPFDSVEDFLARTNFSPAERRALAAVGALNCLCGHRREALWQVEAGVPAGDLFSGNALESGELSPLEMMNHWERIQADYHGLSLTVGSHPMKLLRPALKGVYAAGELPRVADGETIEIAGSVICRQRPGTAKGFVFISLEDETGVANAIVRPDLFERLRLVITQESSLRIRGKLQKHEGVIHLKAEKIEALATELIPEEASHDFH